MSLKIQGLSFQYKANVPLIRQLDLTIPQGKIIALSGVSGCGKSTLIQLILGILKPQAGKIAFDETVLTDDQMFIPTHLRRIGVVFQDYALFPHLTIRENIGYGLKQKGQMKAQTIDRWLKLFALADVAFAYPHQLSGGQMQRVAIARALAPEPSLLLMDEPFSNLDTALVTRIREELKPIFRALKTTVLMVTHHQEDAAFLADDVIEFSQINLLK